MILMMLLPEEALQKAVCPACLVQYLLLVTVCHSHTVVNDMTHVL